MTPNQPSGTSHPRTAAEADDGCVNLSSVPFRFQLQRSNAQRFRILDGKPAQPPAASNGKPAQPPAASNISTRPSMNKSSSSFYNQSLRHLQEMNRHLERASQMATNGVDSSKQEGNTKQISSLQQTNYLNEKTIRRLQQQLADTEAELITQKQSSNEAVYRWKKKHEQMEKICYEIIQKMATKALEQIQSQKSSVTEANDWKSKHNQMEHLYNELLEKLGVLANKNGKLQAKCNQLEVNESKHKEEIEAMENARVENVELHQTIEEALKVMYGMGEKMANFAQTHDSMVNRYEAQVASLKDELASTKKYGSPDDDLSSLTRDGNKKPKLLVESYTLTYELKGQNQALHEELSSLKNELEQLKVEKDEACTNCEVFQQEIELLRRQAQGQSQGSGEERGGSGESLDFFEQTMMAHPSTETKSMKITGRRRGRANVEQFFERPVDIQPESRSSSRTESGSSTEGILSLRRGAISELSSLEYISEMIEIEQTTKVKDWLSSFQNLDPRLQILGFFNDLSLEGVDRFESKKSGIARSSMDVPKLLRGFTKSGIFTVWRPTSPDAIRKMMTGEGTGKGLDIKGKSALRGTFSGFVPFLQISDNSHKSEVGPMNMRKRVRVFYSSEVSRDFAFSRLTELSKPMLGQSLTRTSNNLKDSARLLMIDPKVYKIDNYEGIYGIDVPEKVLWEGYVLPADITRPEGSIYDTGRQSMPAFQQMNIETLRSWDADESGSLHSEGDPRPVLWHSGCGESNEYYPLCPQGLLMAYEENGKVTPVVSDFDCFLLGTRGVKYEKPFRDKELSMLSWCLDGINSILSTPKKGAPWTSRWLEVKKKLVRSDSCLEEMPKYGYADPRSYSIIKGAIQRLKGNGAVRHGPECFNYAFPQELDDQFLVVSDTFPGVPWRYVGPEELIDILCEKIDEGFTFPLNPKWVLCDPGWKHVYDKLLASKKPHVQDSMNIWYPCKIRARIDEISIQFPNGFDNSSSSSNLTDFPDSRTRATLAEFELRKYTIRLSSKRKLQKAISKFKNYDSFGECSIEEEGEMASDSEASQDGNDDNSQR